MKVEEAPPPPLNPYAALLSELQVIPELNPDVATEIVYHCVKLIEESTKLGSIDILAKLIKDATIKKIIIVLPPYNKEILHPKQDQVSAEISALNAIITNEVYNKGKIIVANSLTEPGVSKLLRQLLFDTYLTSNIIKVNPYQVIFEQQNDKYFVEADETDKQLAGILYNGLEKNLNHDTKVLLNNLVKNSSSNFINDLRNFYNRFGEFITNMIAQAKNYNDPRVSFVEYFERAVTDFFNAYKDT